jgi:hypothetical protein
MNETQNRIYLINKMKKRAIKKEKIEKIKNKKDLTTLEKVSNEYQKNFQLMNEIKDKWVKYHINIEKSKKN